MLAEIFLGFVGLIFIWDFWQRKHGNDVLAKSAIPGPKVLPILGNALDIRHINNNSKYSNKLLRF